MALFYYACSPLGTLHGGRLCGSCLTTSYRASCPPGEHQREQIPGEGIHAGQSC